MQRSVAGSLHNSPDPEIIVPKSTDSNNPVLPDNMSASSGRTAIPDSSANEAGGTPNVVTKFIIRAKTPSFSSDSEGGRPEVYHGRSVSMNADKGWEPDVKRLSKSKDKSSRGGSSVDVSATGFKPVFGPVPLPGFKASTLKVPNVSHSRTGSGGSGVTGNTIGTGISGGTTTSGYLDQDELMQRMMGPEQQLKNAENHVKAMQDALKKAFDDRKEAEKRTAVAEDARKEAEKRTAVAEALLKSSLALRANERGESVLLQKYKKTEEDLAICQALLEKSRERAVEVEDRALNAEILIKQMGDNAEGSMKTLIHAGQRELRKYMQLYNVEKERAEKAEALQEEDRKWTVDADERAVFAEEKTAEVTKQLQVAKKVIDQLRVNLNTANSRADKFKKDFNEAEAELESFEQCSQDTEEVTRRVKAQLKKLQEKYNALKKHAATREAEYMACNAGWEAKEADYAAMDAQWKIFGDECTAAAKAEHEKQEEDIEEIIHDRNLIIKTFANRLEQLRIQQRVMNEEELENLVAWAKKEPKMKKGKEVSTAESIAVSREKARRQLEGLAFTPSLDVVEEATFDGPRMDPVKATTANLKLDTAKNGPFDFEGPIRDAAKIASPVSKVASPVDLEREGESMEGLGLGGKKPRVSHVVSSPS
jgi:hypothetical protein